MKKKKNQKKYRVVSKTQKNQSNALKLVLSFIIVFSVYFGMIKANMQFIQDIYIYASFVFAIAFIVCSVKAAYMRQQEKNGDSTYSKSAKITPTKLENLSKIILIIFIPMIFSLLVDYMLIIMNLADYFGI